jgi:sensor c-di-GMP phosphodiesterase-like protein
LQKTWHRQALIWLPAGILIGLLTAAFILRILRRLQSPHHQLQDAIQHRDIKVHYQPIISLKTGKWLGRRRWLAGAGRWELSVT